jgi:hypothetical protein
MSETFNPAPSEWWEATLGQVNPEKRVLTAVLSTGERVFVHEMDVAFSPYAHYFCLPEGTQMSVRIERQKSLFYPFIALEAQFACDDFEPRRERGEIVRWRGDCGGIRRPCKCEIFARLPQFDSLYDRLERGDEVEYDVAYNDVRGNFTAQNLKLVERTEAA